MMKVEDLVGASLTNWGVVPLWELFTTDEDGHASQTVGFFSDRETALAHAKTRPDSAFHGTQEVFVLSNGQIAFIVENEGHKVFSDSEAAQSIRQAALAKLSEAERKSLGLE